MLPWGCSGLVPQRSSLFREGIIASFASIAAQHRRSYRSELWRLVRYELEPYPGRLTKVIHYTVATVVAPILVLTFRLPGVVFGVYYPLLLMKDTPAASFRAAKSCGLFLLFAAVLLLSGAVFVLGSPVWPFFWVVCTLFLAGWLIEAAEDPSAATSFGLFAGTGVEVLDARISPVVRFETILYILLSLLIGIATFLTVQYVLAIEKETNRVRRGLHTRLSAVRDCLEVISEGRIPGPLLQRRLRQYSMVGTVRLRHTLLGLHYSRRVHDEQASAVALIGNMVDFTRNLMDAPSQPVPNQRERL